MTADPKRIEVQCGSCGKPHSVVLADDMSYVCAATEERVRQIDIRE